jgi:hypothetical protein
MAETYFADELDAQTRDYLALVKETNGKGMPGIYLAGSNSLPIISLVMGFVLVVATLFLCFPPTEHPVREAMLQTAGFLTGGWLILAAIRSWMSKGSSLGHFVYVDANALYEAEGAKVRVSDVVDIREAKAVQNFTDGNYQNTVITLNYGKGNTHTLTVKDEEKGRRMTVFMNAVAYMRDGGEDGENEDYQSLSPKMLGVFAKEVAKDGQFPVHMEPKKDMPDVPEPKREGSAPSGLIGILAILVIGIAMFFAFKTINGPIRDDAIYDRIKTINIEKDKAPALRLYLSNPNFKKHRQEAQTLLDGYYDNAISTKVNGQEPAAKKGFGEVINALKTLPQPVVSLQIRDETPDAKDLEKSSRIESTKKGLADWWGSTLGDHLVVFAQPGNPDNPNEPDLTVKGMIDLTYKYSVKEGVPSVQYTIEFRTSPGEKPVSTYTGTFVHGAPFQANVAPAAGGMPLLMNNQQAPTMFVGHLLAVTIGTPQVRPVEPIVIPDF